MARINTSLIAGFDSMTEAEKLKAIMEFEFDDHSKEVEKLRNSVTKANSDAAEWKRKFNETLDAEEQKKNAQLEELESLRSKVTELEGAKKLADTKARYLALGFDDALAGETAKAHLDGDMDKVFANQKAFLDNHDKDVKAQMMRGTQQPTVGGGENKTDYSKMIADAQANGNFAAAAYYTRLQATEEAGNK